MMTDEQVASLKWIVAHNGRCGKYSVRCSQCPLRGSYECDHAGPYDQPSKEIVAASKLLLEQREVAND